MLSAYHPILLSLFESLQRLAADPYGRAREAQAIQNTLIKQVTAAEERIRIAKQATDQPQEVTEPSDADEELIETERLLLNILRDVGDGLAFTYLDKWDIKPMAFKQSPGFLYGKEGLAKELAIFNDVFDRGGIAILNDLTHCLRYGDVTVIKEDLRAFVEVKVGRKLNQRGRRQRAANEKIANYLRTDRVVGLYGLDHEICRIDLGRSEVNHAHALREMIEEAVQRGRCYRQVEPGLNYMVDTDNDISGLTAAIESIKGQPYLCMVNMLKGNNTAYSPFTLSIANPERLYEFYNGEYMITVVVDLDHVARFAKGLGFTASFHQDGPLFLTLTKDEPPEDRGYLEVSAHMWNRLFAEFVGLEWLLTESADWYAGMNARADSTEEPQA